jgi:20S proteasome subunit alpha 6
LSIGARAQSARTSLEKNIALFENASLEDLSGHVLMALRDSLPQGIELDSKNCSLAVVGKDTPFHIIEGEALEPILAAIRSV